MQPWKMYARYQGGRNWISEHVLLGAPGWGDAEIEEIEEIRFPFEGQTPSGPDNLILVCRGFEAYNFLVDACAALGQGEQIQGLFFFGKHPGGEMVERARIGRALMDQSRIPFGQEFQGAPTRGWKSGLRGQSFMGIFKRVK